MERFDESGQQPNLTGMKKSANSPIQSNDSPRKIALFGGTFDPIHEGHVFIASEAQRLCELDEVIFIPCWQSPHKPGRKAEASHHRIAMVELAITGHSWASVSDFEATRTEASYSWQTARHFSEVFPAAKLYWILGVDQWDVIDTWGRPDVLAELLTFIVFGRNGMIPEQTPPFKSIFLPGTFDVSATELREALAEDRPCNGLNTDVLAYVRKHRLYSSLPD